MGVFQGSGFDFKPYVHPVYSAIMARLTNQDQDQVSSIGNTKFCFFLFDTTLEHLIILPFQEVKESAITCMGLVVSTFGDHLRAEIPACLPVLVDRMGNEITRLTAVKVGLISRVHLDIVSDTV